MQGELEKALETALRMPTAVTGCGRTDTGVHAKNFYAHFESNQKLTAFEMVNKLNALLPEDIAVHSFFDVKEDIHARFSAISRTYEYYIHFDRNPFFKKRSYHWFGALPDIDLLNEGSEYLKTLSNFKAFSKSRTQVKTYECDLQECYWAFDQKQLIFRVRANRFLRNMVRAMVGTLLDLATEKITLEQLKDIMQSGNRSAAGTSVPAHGLYLVHVEYPFDDFVL